MVLIATFTFIGALATSPSGSCASNGENRCGVENSDSKECSCNTNCLTRGDCCADYGTVCHSACPAHTADLLLCRDNTECDPLTDPDAFACCSRRGGKLKCPSSRPYMCTGINQGLGSYSYAPVCGDDHCCMKSPFMCTHFLVARAVLQDCPAAIGAKPSICPYTHGFQEAGIGFPAYLGSIAHEVLASSNMTTLSDGLLSPGSDWKFCPSSDEFTKIQCKSGARCDALTHELKWNCCQDEGGLYKCPGFNPVMCREKTCGVGEDEHCCRTSAAYCTIGPIVPGANGETCPKPHENVPVATVTEIRQCSANFPVMCDDKSCVKVKTDCARVRTDCPIVPSCVPTGEWNETVAVGGTAFMPCGNDAGGKARAGLKYRPCLSVFDANRTERAQWGDESEIFCRDVVPRCNATRTAAGGPVPSFEVGVAYYVNKTDCPMGMSGVTEYHCMQADVEAKYEVSPICETPCTREHYCSRNGEATSVANDHGVSSGEICQCTCDAGWAGRRCGVVAWPTQIHVRSFGRLRRTRYVAKERTFVMTMEVTRSLSPGWLETMTGVVSELLSLGKSESVSAFGMQRKGSVVYYFSKRGLTREEAQRAREIANAASFQVVLAAAMIKAGITIVPGEYFQQYNLIRVSGKIHHEGQHKEPNVWRGIARALIVVSIITCAVLLVRSAHSIWRRRNKFIRDSGDREEDERSHTLE